MEFSKLDWFDNVEYRQHPWPGLNWLTPMLYVPNVLAAVHFYERAFAFVPIFQLPDEKGSLSFARMRYRGSNFTLSKDGSFEFAGQCPQKSQTLPPLMFYLYVDDVDLGMEQALAAGCELLQQARLEFSGRPKGQIARPFRLCLGACHPYIRCSIALKQLKLFQDFRSIEKISFARRFKFFFDLFKMRFNRPGRELINQGSLLGSLSFQQTTETLALPLREEVGLFQISFHAKTFSTAYSNILVPPDQCERKSHRFVREGQACPKIAKFRRSYLFGRDKY